MEGPSGDLRLPTLSVMVELSRVGRAREHAELFLPGGEDVARRGRTAVAGELATLLESEPPFLPVRERDPAGAMRVALIGKHSFVWVSIGLEEEEPGDVLALYDHQHGVRVELDGGETIVGHVLYSSPADRPRLADHLNLAPRFLRVWTATALYLVNKQHIVRVLEQD
jgi:hypothetical protein